MSENDYWKEMSKLLDQYDLLMNKLQMDIAIFGVGGGVHHPDGTFEYKTPEELDEIFRKTT